MCWGYKNIAGIGDRYTAVPHGIQNPIGFKSQRISFLPAIVHGNNGVLTVVNWILCNGKLWRGLRDDPAVCRTGKHRRIETAILCILKSTGLVGKNSF